MKRRRRRRLSDDDDDDDDALFFLWVVERRRWWFFFFQNRARRHIRRRADTFVTHRERESLEARQKEREERNVADVCPGRRRGNAEKRTRKEEERREGKRALEISPHARQVRGNVWKLGRGFQGRRANDGLSSR